MHHARGERPDPQRQSHAGVDFNRGGVPLVEIVARAGPAHRRGGREYLTLLRAILSVIGVNDGNLEEGSFRCDANVSVRPVGSDTELGAKRAEEHELLPLLERGVRAEIERQIGLRVGRTRRAETCASIRPGATAHAAAQQGEGARLPLLPGARPRPPARYRGDGRGGAGGDPERPAERAVRFERDLALHRERAVELAFRTEQADFFERALAAPNGRADAAAIANWMQQLVERIGSDADPADSKVTPEAFAMLVALVGAGAVSRDAGREVLTRLVSEGGDPGAIVERENLGAISGGDDGLAEIVARALASDPAAAEKVRAGNMKAIGPLVGFVMRETKGRADGGEVTRLIREALQS